MAAPEKPSAQDTISDLVQLTKSYALQETVDPIKGLTKFVGFGLGAAAIGGIGMILVLLGVLRLLQTETGTRLQGHLSWVPYLVTLVVSFVLVGIAVAGIARKKDTRS